MIGTSTIDTEYLVNLVQENAMMKQRIEKLENYIMKDNCCTDETGEYRFVFVEDMKLLGITQEQMDMFIKVKELEN